MNKNLPEYNYLVEDPPWMINSNSEYISIEQWEGTGEFHHCVLIPRNELDSFIESLLIER